MIGADALVYAAPLYCWCFPAQMKALIDRHVSLVTGFETPKHKSLIEGKKTEDRGRWTEDQLLQAVKKELLAGKSAKEISAELAGQSGWNKKEVYALVNQKK